MSWRRRQYRAGERPERAFARRVGYETAKEGGGTLLQQAGAALGALMGLLSSKWGLPPSASVITGAIVGGTIGSLGKGFVAASLDQLRERREQQRSRAVPRSAGRVLSWRHPTGSDSSGHSTRFPSRRRAASSIAGQVIGSLDQIIDQLDRAEKQLVKIHQKLWANQNALLAVLAGSRPEIVRTTEASLTKARNTVQETAGLLATVKEDLNAYRARF